MKRLTMGLLAVILSLAAGAPTADAAGSYFEDWSVSGDLAGWTANTTQATAGVVDVGGNPGGYLQSVRDAGGVFPIGAVTLLPAATGDYAAAGIFEVSFDVRFETANFNFAAFRVRYLDASYNGWFFPFTNDFTPGVWRSYAIPFNPAWTDAEALAAGWVQEATSATFAETFSNVFWAEVRLDGPGEPLTAGIDNFRLRACTNPTPILSADFSADTPGNPPDLTLPGGPAGDYLALSEESGTVRVAAAVGTLTDQPVLMDQVPGIGSVHLFAYPAPIEDCGVRRVGWNSLARSNDIFFLACVLRDAGGLILGSVEYRPNGELTYNSVGGVGPTLPVTYTPDVDQRFEISVDHVAKTTSLSIDGVAVPGFQNVPYAEAAATGLARLGFEAGGTVAQQFAFDNIAIAACDCPCEEDATPPAVTVTVDRDVLWPPNHKLVEVCATVEVSDNCDPAPTVELLSVTSDEPDNGLGDGDTENDIQILADNCFLLRSERQGGGDGREYTITYCATDASGNTNCGSVVVTVPHDQSGHAFASFGFSGDGTELQARGDQYALVIQSTSAFNSLTAVDPARTLVGNERGVVSATRTQKVDADGNGLLDLRLFFDAEATAQLLAAGSDRTSPVALRYETTDGTGYLVPDILALGPPIESLVDVGPGAGGVSAVGPAYPNPFVSSTRVEYTVGSATGGRVELAVYDPSGRRVRTLFSGTRTAGRYTAVWDGDREDGSRATPGVYFLKADLAGFRSVGKIMLLK